MGLLRSIEEAAFALLSQLGSPPPRRIQQGSLRGILAQLQTMKTYVDGTVDTRLDFYTEVGSHAGQRRRVSRRVVTGRACELIVRKLAFRK